MLKRTTLFAMIGFLIVLSAGSAVAQLVSGSPDQSATAIYDDSNPHPDLLNATASGTLTLACNPKSAIYMQWSLSNVATNGPISGFTKPTKLTLPVSATSGTNPLAAQFTLYGIDDASETWNEATLNGGSSATQPPIATLPTSLGAASISGGQLVFDSSTNSPGLISYLNGKPASPGGTLVVIMTTCAFGVQSVSFGGADLSMYDVNSVTLSTFAAEKSTPTWPLYAGLGAVALVVIAGLAVSRRRTA
jgi:hypothetical protein